MARIEHLSDDIVLHQGDAFEIVGSMGTLDCLVTDPPYGMEFRSNHRKTKHAAIKNDSNESALLWACSLPVRHSRYVFCRWDNLYAVPKPRSLVNWVKNNWSMGDLEHEHARQTEVALFYPGPEHRFPNGRPTDVVNVARTRNDLHPTEKPVVLMMKVLGWTEGTIVDPFCGSGTTGLAAIRCGRSFVGVEMDAVHFDTACRRLADELARPNVFNPPPKALTQEAMW